MCPRLQPFRSAVLCLCVLAGASSAAAQALPPQLPGGQLTLEQVLEIAQARSEAVAIARAGIDRADADRIRARSGLLPTLSLSAGYDRSLASEFEGVFSGSSSTPCAPFTLNPQGSIDARVAEIERAIDCGAVGSSFFGGGSSAGNGTTEGGLGDLPFGRTNTWRATLTFSQNIYSGGRNGAQTAVAAAERTAAGLALRTTTGQLVFDATQAYFDAALSARLVEIAQATLDQADATLRQVQAGFDAGTQPEFEVLRARVNRDNQSPVLIRQRVDRAVALLRLKQLLDLPVTADLEIADALRDETLEPPAPFAQQVAAVESAMKTTDSAAAIAQQLSTPLPRRAAVDSAEADLERARASLRLAEAQKMPSVTVNSSYGRVTYPAGVFWDFSSLRTNWTIGASVQVPILTGGRQRGDELAARADVDESRIRLQQLQEQSGLDTRVAWVELLAARATWEATAGTVEQATRAYQIAEVRYQAGVGTQLELSDARLLLQQAEANRAQAARDVQVARARVALLPELPVSTAVPGGAGARATVERQTPVQPQQTGTGTLQTSGVQGAQTQAGR
ncbi:MAG TPA: TolC family protein [Vicinamibacterales bacterium]|nr:TolC family protein [Vicinamibacterales bacterium]